MSMLPAAYHTTDYIYHVDQLDIEVSIPECVFRSVHPCDVDLFNLCITLMTELNLDAPTDPLSATYLYLTLRESIRTELGMQ